MINGARMTGGRVGSAGAPVRIGAHGGDGKHGNLDESEGEHRVRQPNGKASEV